MTALELLSERTPRSQTTVELCREQIARSSKRLANGLAIGFAAFTAAMLIIFGIVEIATDSSLELREALQSAAAIAFLGGVFPGWLLRKLIMRDVAKAARIARDGVAYKATIVRRVVGPALIPLIELAWTEGDRRIGARFPLTDKNETADPDQLVVLSGPTHKLVLGLFADCGIYAGSRIGRVGQ